MDAITSILTIAVLAAVIPLAYAAIGTVCCFTFKSIFPRVAFLLNRPLGLSDEMKAKYDEIYYSNK